MLLLASHPSWPRRCAHPSYGARWPNNQLPSDQAGTANHSIELPSIEQPQQHLVPPVSRRELLPKWAVNDETLCGVDDDITAVVRLTAEGRMFNSYHYDNAKVHIHHFVPRLYNMLRQVEKFLQLRLNTRKLSLTNSRDTSSLSCDKDITTKSHTLMHANQHSL